MGTLYWLAIVPVLGALIVAWRRPDLRRQMFWGGLLAVPVFLIVPTSYSSLYGNDLIRVIGFFSLGAFVSGLYEALLSRRLVLGQGQSRHPLTWLIAGPMTFLILTVILPGAFLPLIISLLVEVITITIIRRDLVWDVLFSGAVMAVFYLALLVLTVRLVGSTVGISPLIEGELSGLTTFGIPIEELIIVALFGALWGPLYPAAKDLKLVR